MAGEQNKISIKAVAKLEKYDDKCSQEDIKQGKVKPYETLQSKDMLIEPTEENIKRLQDIGMAVDPEVIKQMKKSRRK